MPRTTASAVPACRAPRTPQAGVFGPLTPARIIPSAPLTGLRSHLSHIIKSSKNGCSSASSTEILSRSSLHSISLHSPAASSDIFPSSSSHRFDSTTLSSVWSLSVPWNGYFAVSILNSTTPHAHTSTFSPYRFPSTISGGTYSGVPTAESSVLSAPRMLERPKSARTQPYGKDLLRTRTLPSLMSRCTIFLRWRHFTPRRTSCRHCRVCGSGRGRPAAARTSKRVPPGTRSMTMERESERSKMSTARTRLGCASWRMMWTSRMRNLRLASLAATLRTTLRAYSSLVSRSTHLTTFPKVPWPRTAPGSIRIV
mmetsp:Transcript_5774/g.14009  ORF Transcript_5774/g.14009 Transcript_5774/m.14009 type:complete len:312 (-) Transcript_5774:406-1341(-)